VQQLWSLSVLVEVLEQGQTPHQQARLVHGLSVEMEVQVVSER
jgi:hypothetical protein